MLSSTDIELGKTIIITSDNCTSQYKSAHNFFDLQRLADHYECTIILIYDAAGHGKNEVDAVSCIAKISIRNAVAWSQSILDKYFIVYLNDNFEIYDSPSYSVKLTDTEKLNEELQADIWDFPQ